MSFSERYAFVTRAIQTDSIDSQTRNQLWNQMYFWILTFHVEYSGSNYAHSDDTDKSKYFFMNIWTKFFNYKRNHFPDDYEYPDKIIELCENYLDSCQWFRYYDFIEFILVNFNAFSKHDAHKDYKDLFVEKINDVLNKEKCSYRLVSDLFIPVTGEGEITSIVTSLQNTENILTVHTHLKQALLLFSDRTNPDYRNSSKESISALESLLKVIAKSPKSTLTDALKKIKANNLVDIHPNIINTISSLYNWSSDESSIRHALRSDKSIDIEDAQLTLNTCCGLVNYLISKCIKSNINL